MQKIQNNRLVKITTMLVLGTALYSALTNNYGIALAGIIIYLTSLEIRKAS